MSYPNGYAGIKLSPTFFQDTIEYNNKIHEERKAKEAEAKAKEAKQKREYKKLPEGAMRE